MAYYVRPDGNDSNPGTGYLASQAWATVTKAASTVPSYEVCYIAPGFYSSPGTGPITIANSSITLTGDPSCEFFLDMTPGDVIIGSRNSLHGNTTYATNTISINNKSAINLMNLIVESHGGAALYGGGVSARVGIYNCTIKGPISTFTKTSYPNIVIMQSRFYRTEFINCANVDANASFFANLYINQGSLLCSYNFCNSYINLNTVTLSTSTNTYNVLTFAACNMRIAAGRGSASGYAIVAPSTYAGRINFTNTVIEEGGNIIDISTNGSGARVKVEGCKIKNLNQFLKRGVSGTSSFDYNSFENVGRVYEITNASYSITPNYNTILNCALIGSNYVTFTNSTFQYSPNLGGATTSGGYSTTLSDSNQYGIFTSTTNVFDTYTQCLVSKTGQSLEDYMPMYYFWVDYVAGVEKTVSFKFRGVDISEINVQVVSTAVDDSTKGYSFMDGLASNTTYTISMSYTHYKTEKVMVIISVVSAGMGIVAIGDISI